MFLPLLLTIFIVLCIALIAIGHRAETQVKQFLATTTTIVDEKSLNEYKSLVKKSMYLTLAFIVMACITFFVSIVLIWVKGFSGALSLPLLGVSLGFAKDAGKFEEKARSLPCANSDLERRYQEISKIWVKQALPNF